MKAVVDPHASPRGLLSMMLMASATGVIAGFGAWGFRMLIGLVHNLMFLGKFSLSTMPTCIRRRVHGASA